MPVELPGHSEEKPTDFPSLDVSRTTRQEQKSAERSRAESPDLASAFETLKLESPKRQSPKESVLALARDALRLGQKTYEEIYELAHFAEGRTRKPLEDKDIRAYLQDLRKISMKCDRGVDSHPRNSMFSTHEFLRQYPNGIDADAHEVSFYEAISRDKDSYPHVARLSVRLEPDQAMKVFEYVTSELVIKHPLVKAAKLTGPYEIHERDDSMIIYLLENNKEQARQIALDLAEIFSPRCFGSHVPVGMKKMAPGIGYAEESTTEATRSTAIAKAIEEAIQQHDSDVSKLPEAPEGPTNESLYKFEKEFLPQALKRYHIDPNKPYKNT